MTITDHNTEVETAESDLATADASATAPTTGQNSKEPRTMSLKKITAPAGPIVNGPFSNIPNDEDLYFVEGVAYTDTPVLLAYFTKKGYGVEDATTIPTKHQRNVDAFREQTTNTGRKQSVPLQDADNEYRNYISKV